MYNNCNLFELRGAWVATVFAIDWPKSQNDIEAQKKNL